jgi:hypothetical protein
MADLTAEQSEALAAFAKEYGRKWKVQLGQVYWPNARVWENYALPDPKQHGYILHGLRNSHGPAWLDKFRLPGNAKD